MTSLMSMLKNPWFYVAVAVAGFVINLVWGLIAGKLRPS